MVPDLFAPGMLRLLWVLGLGEIKISSKVCSNAEGMTHTWVELWLRLVVVRKTGRRATGSLPCYGSSVCKAARREKRVLLVQHDELQLVYVSLQDGCRVDALLTTIITHNTTCTQMKAFLLQTDALDGRAGRQFNASNSSLLSARHMRAPPLSWYTL